MGTVVVLSLFTFSHLRKKAPSSPLKKTAKLNTVEYDRRMKMLAHVSTAPVAAISPASQGVKPSTATAKQPAWPVLAPTPKAGAILPFKRVVAYYGNFYSTKMGILGEFPEEEVFSRLKVEMAQWNAADPQTPVLPAIHYIAVTAQGYAGEDQKYRLRMPKKEIEKALTMAQKIGAITFLDIQIGKSTVQNEVSQLDLYWKRPDVHLGLDPEFSMKGEAKPGEKIGTMDAAEINWAIKHLSKIVEQNNLPPKILVIHRFVVPMVTNSKLIRPTPQVQVVMDMDGWGTPSEKKKTFDMCITKYPVQFAGFKVFYKNDTRKEGSRLMTPEEILRLKPKPIYIQYQ